jgi:SAM-dependent methyltransferase
LDSDLGSDASIRSISVTSSIYAYRYENGRRYHAFRDGNYLLPNDETEQDRMDLDHHIYSLVLNDRLFRAPIGSHPQRVLDLGTGTGMWAIDFADDHPSAVVIGTDLSPIQPTVVPPNCIFYVDDFEGPWTFGPNEAFDFIHGRGIVGSVRNFDQLYGRIYSNLKPGGWVEIQEIDAFISSDDDPNREKIPNIAKTGALLKEASHQFGKLINAATDQRQHMINAGFRDVRDDVYKVCQRD